MPLRRLKRTAVVPDEPPVDRNERSFRLAILIQQLSPLLFLSQRFLLHFFLFAVPWVFVAREFSFVPLLRGGMAGLSRWDDDSLWFLVLKGLASVHFQGTLSPFRSFDASSRGNDIENSARNVSTRWFSVLRLRDILRTIFSFIRFRNLLLI